MAECHLIYPNECDAARKGWLRPKRIVIPDEVTPLAVRSMTSLTRGLYVYQSTPRWQSPQSASDLLFLACRNLRCSGLVAFCVGPKSMRKPLSILPIYFGKIVGCTYRRPFGRDHRRDQMAGGTSVRAM